LSVSVGIIMRLISNAPYIYIYIYIYSVIKLSDTSKELIKLLSLVFALGGPKVGGQVKV
jgi:hypothetical protein